MSRSYSNYSSNRSRIRHNPKAKMNKTFTTQKQHIVDDKKREFRANHVANIKQYSNTCLANDDATGISSGLIDTTVDQQSQLKTAKNSEGIGANRFIRPGTGFDLKQRGWDTQNTSALNMNSMEHPPTTAAPANVMTVVSDEAGNSKEEEITALASDTQNTQSFLELGANQIKHQIALKEQLVKGEMHFEGQEANVSSVEEFGEDDGLVRTQADNQSSSVGQNASLINNVTMHRQQLSPSGGALSMTEYQIERDNQRAERDEFIQI